MPKSKFEFINPHFFQTQIKSGGYLFGLLLISFFINACQPVEPINKSINPIILTSSSIRTPVPTISLRQEPVPKNTYYVAVDGKDSDPGTLSQPWKTIHKVTTTVNAGDLVYIRGGNYAGIDAGWIFQNSGSQSNPITLTNYPGEQVIFGLTGDMFVCSINQDNQAWKTPKADHIRIIGTDVHPLVLSNNVESKKGIVIQGAIGAQGAGFSASDCDNWEVAGLDFVDVGYGIFTFKNNWGLPEEHSTDNWYVHDNRVYGFYRESGMQFNGDNNLIENNEIYKVTNRVDTPYGCQLLNILGDNNIVRGNTLSGLGSTALCPGIMFEWDMADTNLVEQNLIYDVKIGIDIEGGDNNMIRNNIIYREDEPGPFNAGIEIQSYENTKTNWPCNEESGSAQALLPPNDPSHLDYENYYTSRNCHSTGTQIYNNVIDGFVEGIRFYPLAGEGTVIRNNIFSRWSRGGICFYNDNGTCKELPSEVTESNNATKNFGFVDLKHYNYHLAADSPLIDDGYDLMAQNPYDFNGENRPQGEGYDIGAYESPAVPAR